MDYETITYEILEDGIVMLSLNRPQDYNAVNQKMVEELESFWKERLYDIDTHVIILKGNGEKGFCAGLDLKETMDMAPNMATDKFYYFQSRLSSLILAMRRAPQPIICAVHGAAAGAGFSFVLASDVRIITEDARFSAAYINIGVGGADMSSSYFLPRLIGAGRAYEFLLTGNYMSSDEAMELGLASRVVKRDAMINTAIDLARIMNSKNPLGLSLTKEAINMNIDAGGLEQALKMEDRNQTLLVYRNMLQQKEGGKG
ncbi:MAG: enoyl-CoA hydratase/isomerase family protein [Thermodesulfobacteriota bacterium]|nr:enoyl-CoA hydratase/isomerase family protein [Thermodesulfobacteriota bacterium]